MASRSYPNLEITIESKMDLVGVKKFEPTAIRRAIETSHVRSILFANFSPDVQYNEGWQENEDFWRSVPKVTVEWEETGRRER